MNIVNRVIFIGFITSGFSVLLGLALSKYFGEKPLLKENIIPLFLSYGVFIGYFCTIFGFVLFFVGLIQMKLGKLKNIWKSLYTLNFIFSLIPITFILS